jgi:hypothetical protein
MTSEIVLVSVDAPAPEDVPESAAPETHASPAKRGRGRPPGAKNKTKPPIEPVETKRPPPPEESEEEPPPPVVKRANRRPAPPPSDSEEEEREPSPRARRRQMQVDVQNHRHNQHLDRVRNYSTILDGMLSY